MPVARVAGAHPAVVKAQEVQALAAFGQVHDPRLGVLGHKAQLGQLGSQRREGVTRLALASATCHEIVGITDQPSPPARPPRPVEPVQVDVGEQRRDNPALRVPVTLERNAPASITPARNRAPKSLRTWRSTIRS